MRVPVIVLVLAMWAVALSIGIAVSWATGIGTDVNGRPCLTHWSQAEGCHGD